MRKFIIILFALFGINILLAQSVFVWDRDNESTIINPDDPWVYVGLEYAILNALTENGITPVIDTVLPDNISGYYLLKFFHCYL